MERKLPSILRNSIQISDVVGEYITLSKKGKNFFGLCPFHADKNPSLVVNNDKQHFKCFVCGESGDLITFVMKKENVPFNKALVNLAKKYNIESNEINALEKKFHVSQNELEFYEINLQAKEIYHNFLMQKQNEKVRNYLYQRGLTDEDLKKFMIGFAPQERTFLTDIMSNRTKIFGENRSPKLIWELNKLLKNELSILNDDGEYQDFFYNRIIFPIHDEWKRVVGFSGRDIKNNPKIKYLNSRTSQYFKKDTILFNMENVWNKNYEKLFLTEGFMDVIFAFKNGIENIVGSMGVEISGAQINKIKKQKFETIIVSMDNDRAGIVSNMKIAKNLTRNFNSVMIIQQYDSDCKDLADLAMKLKSAKKFSEKMHDYVPCIEYTINTIFAKKQSAIDVKLRNVKKISKEIALYGDVTLKNYYAQLLANKTDFLLSDIMQTIDSFSKNKNEHRSNNHDLLEANQYFENNDVMNLQENVVNEKTNIGIKNLNLEKQLILIMVFYPDVARVFIDNLNDIQFLQEDIDYNLIVNSIRKLITSGELNYTKKDVLRLVEKYSQNNFRINKLISHYDSKRTSNILIAKKQGMEIIQELIGKKIKNIQKITSRKIKVLYEKNASKEIMDSLRSATEKDLEKFYLCKKNVEDEIKALKKDMK